VHGPLFWNPSPGEREWLGLRDVREVTASVQAAADGPARGIFLDVDSPGGMHMGGEEAAQAVAEARRKKPVVAWAGGMMTSLAYEIAAQAGTTVATGSATVGSVGVRLAFFDITGLLDSIGIKAEVFTNQAGIFKAAGFPGKPLTDAQRAQFQGLVDRIGDEFIASITARRNIAPDAMRGQVLTGRQAAEAGMLDAIASRAAALQFTADLAR
jgi:protease-4